MHSHSCTCMHMYMHTDQHPHKTVHTQINTCFCVCLAVFDFLRFSPSFTGSILSKCFPSLNHLNAHGNWRARIAFTIARGDQWANNRGFIYIKAVFISCINVSRVAVDDTYKRWQISPNIMSTRVVCLREINETVNYIHSKKSSPHTRTPSV